MNILLFDNGTKYLSKLNDLLENFGKVSITDNVNDLFSKQSDTVVLSGGHKKYITEHPEAYQKEIEFIKNSNKPVLGVCLGAEIIAYSFGAKLELLSHNQNGLIKINILTKDIIFNEIKDFEVYENHKLTITSLSPNLVGLAKSQDGFEVIKHVNKPIYGLQFHPEMFEDKTCGDEIFKNIFNLLNK